MEGHITISVPSLLLDWQSCDENPERISKLGLPHCTGMAYPDMVFTVTDNVIRLSYSAPAGPRLAIKSRSETAPSPGRREIIPDYMAYLQQRYEMQGFSESVTELLIESWRSNIKTSYNSAWCK